MVLGADGVCKAGHQSGDARAPERASDDGTDGYSDFSLFSRAASLSSGGGGGSGGGAGSGSYA